jgi:cytochrome c oxidase accessory protein FixG
VISGAPRVKVQAASVSGRFQRIHRWTGLLLQSILVLVPWLTVSGHPAVLFDLGGRRLYLLGEIFTPRDTIFLVILLLLAAFSLFLFTSLFGRLWCGYACPQTVYMEEWVRPIERYFEGERGQRLAFDKAPWSAGKAARKVGKWSAFLALAAFVAMVFMSWFVPARELWTGAASPVSYALVGALSALMFADFAWFREQFCNYLCPYARFQGALTDEHSLNVAYRVDLGEPRRSKEPGPSPVEGRCIDCKKCVVACPQGIDIRQGFQLECIACARCVDACEEVMGKRDQPTLIQYSSLAELKGRPARRLRPRTVAYAALLTVLSTAGVALLSLRQEIQATLSRAPGSLYSVDPDGALRNTFILSLVDNRAEGEATPVQVRIEGLEGAELVLPPVELHPGEARKVPVVVRHRPEQGLDRTLPFVLIVAEPAEELSVQVSSTFKSGEVADES